MQASATSCEAAARACAWSTRFSNSSLSNIHCAIVVDGVRVTEEDTGAAGCGAAYGKARDEGI